MKFIMLFFIALFAIIFACCSFTNKEQKPVVKQNKDKIMSTNLDTAVFGSGCFWCTEAIFEELKGVQSVEAGYWVELSPIRPTRKYALEVPVMPKLQELSSTPRLSLTPICSKFSGLLMTPQH